MYFCVVCVKFKLKVVLGNEIFFDFKEFEIFCEWVYLISLKKKKYVIGRNGSKWCDIINGCFVLVCFLLFFFLCILKFFYVFINRKFI